MSASAISINITVDDTFGNSDGSVIPTYLPVNDTWHVGSPSEQCEICTIKPSELDPTQIVDQSWHHATYFFGIPIQVRVTFPGTAVYVYNVVPNFLPNGAITFVNISFVLDGETVGHFVHVPDNSSAEILYNHLVYANAGLPDGLHTLVMSASGSEPSLFFFDYLLYATEVEATTSATAAVTSDTSLSVTASASSAHPPIMAIIGGVVGGVVLLLLVATLLFCRLRHRRRKARPLTPGDLDFWFTEAIVPSITISESSIRPVSVGLLSNAATVAGPSLGSGYGTTRSPSSQSSRTFAPSPEREIELKRRIEALQREMDTTQPSQHRQERRSSNTSGGLGLGAVRALRGEIAALRDVLSATAGPCHDYQPAISEVLPGYEEARRAQPLREGGNGNGNGNGIEGDGTLAK